MQGRLHRRRDALLVWDVTPHEPGSLLTHSTSRPPASGPKTSDPLSDSDDDVRRFWNDCFMPYLGSIRPETREGVVFTHDRHDSHRSLRLSAARCRVARGQRAAQPCRPVSPTPPESLETLSSTGEGSNAIWKPKQGNRTVSVFLSTGSSRTRSEAGAP